MVLLAILAALPAAACALYLIWIADWPAHTQITFTVVIVGAWMLCAIALRERVVFPLQTLANLLELCARAITRCAAALTAITMRWAR